MTMQQSTPPAAPAPNIAEIIGKVSLAGGNIAGLSDTEKLLYYNEACRRVGLDPLSTPFRFLSERGKTTLYCDRSGTQQLTKVHSISVEILARETVSGCYVVTARAKMPDGRSTESIGAVPIENKRGEEIANSMMKAETKAKRRAILDLVGLGMLDESEIGSIMGATTSDPLTGTPDPVPAGSGAVQASGGANTPPDRPSAGIGSNNAGGGSPAPDPWRTKYGTAEEVEAMLEKVDYNWKPEALKLVAALYYVNQELVESNKDLKRKFSEVKADLGGYETAAGGAGNNASTSNNNRKNRDI